MAWIEQRSGKYLVRWREPDGQKRSATRRTKSEARALKAEVDDQLHKGTYVARAIRDQPFGDYVVEVLEADLSLEASTLYQQKRAYTKWVDPYLGDTPIGDIDAAMVRRWFAAMRRDGATDATIARVRSVMTKYFRRAHQEGIIQRNPLASVPAPKTERRDIRILTPEEVQSIADAHPSEYRLIPLLSAWGTFRIGEVAALTTSSVDGDRVRVSQSVAVAAGRTYLKGPKSAAGRRVVQLPAWVASELRAHILALAPGQDQLFLTRSGALLSHNSYHPIWREALKGFPEPWPRPHDLRHTAVALMIRAGAHPKVIQARCGHSTIRETMDTYGHLFPGQDEALVQALEGFRPTDGTVVALKREAGD